MNILNNNRRLRSRLRGYTLVELMVSLTLSAILMTGVAQVFVGMRQSDRSQEENSQIQDSGRFALNFLTQDIRMSGFLGCSSTIDPTTINNTLTGAPASFQPGRGIQGWEADGSDPGTVFNSVNNETVGTASGTGGANWGTSAGNQLDSTRAVDGTDIIRVWSAGNTIDEEGTVLGITVGSTTSVNVSTMPITAGNILLLSDCEQADWVQVCTSSLATVGLDLALSTGCTPGNVANANIGTSPDDGRAVKLEGTIYYIGKRDNLTTNPPSLFRRRLGTDARAGNPEELVEGVEDMQILYGENINNDNRNTADRYVPADQVSDWNAVVSVRITLLVQSLANNLVPAPQPYTYNAVTYDGVIGGLPPDNRVRRVFSSTIDLRNRSL